MGPTDDFRDGGRSQTWRFLVARTQIVHVVRSSPTFLRRDRSACRTTATGTYVAEPGLTAMSLRLLALVAVATIDPAPQSPTPRSMTFDDALGLTATTPRVVGNARAVNEKAALDREISALPYNPQVTVMPGWRFAPRDARQPELVAEIIQPWNLSGQPSARRRTVGLEEKVLEAEARATALAARLAAARALDRRVGSRARARRDPTARNSSRGSSRAPRRSRGDARRHDPS